MLGFWIVAGFIIVLGAGLFVDIVLAVIYCEKWRGFFKANLVNVPWFFRDLLKICSLLVFIVWIIYLVEYILIKSGLWLKPITNVVNTLGIYGLSIWIIVHFLTQKYHVGLSALGIKWRSWFGLSIKSTLFYLGFIPILAVLTYLSIIFCNVFGIEPLPHPLVEMLKREKSIWSISYLIITAVFIAPVFEELVFRGLIYQGIKKHIGPFKAVLFSSIVFSLLHFNISQFLPVLGLGALLCFIFEHTGSLVPAVIIHMLNNGIFLGLFLLLKEYI